MKRAVAVLVAAGLGSALPGCMMLLLTPCPTSICGGRSPPLTVNIEGARTRAERGDAEAECTMGAVYDTRSSFGLSSDAPKKNDAMAVHWYRAAADQGNGCGQFYLAGMYETGRAVERDDVIADMWYCLAISALHTTLADDATRKRDDLEKRMTPEQITEARRRAQEWKPVTSPQPS